jgi:hypothetical protein
MSVWKLSSLHLLFFLNLTDMYPLNQLFSGSFRYLSLYHDNQWIYLFVPLQNKCVHFLVVLLIGLLEQHQSWTNIFFQNRTNHRIALPCMPWSWLHNGTSIGNIAKSARLLFVWIHLITNCSGEILAYKAGFKNEIRFNSIVENTKTETLSWCVDSAVTVPAHYQTTASIVIEEINYHGAYSMQSRLSG